MVEDGKVVYGITTGFGKFSDVLIQKDDVKALQHNLIQSHACGIGASIPGRSIAWNVNFTSKHDA
ncbi:aromatic amino acid lyase [Bacillus cereus]